MGLSADCDRAGIMRQRGIWDRYPALYQREVDKRFVPVVQQVLRRVALVSRQQILDLGTGTGQEARDAVKALMWPYGDSPPLPQGRPVHRGAAAALGMKCGHNTSLQHSAQDRLPECHYHSRAELIMGERPFRNENLR